MVVWELWNMDRVLLFGNDSRWNMGHLQVSLENAVYFSRYYR